MYASQECEVVHHPNKMVFTDDKGKRWEIYIPARDYYKVIAHSRKEEWSELAKFPKWGELLFPPTRVILLICLPPWLMQIGWAENQGYTDADNLKNITDPKTFFSVPPFDDDDAPQTAETSKENDASKKK